MGFPTQDLHSQKKNCKFTTKCIIYGFPEMYGLCPDTVREEKLNFSPLRLNG